MRSIRFNCVTILLVAICSVTAPADDQSDQVDQLFEKWDKPGSPGAAVGVIQEGKLIYSKGCGLANLDHDIPIDDQSVFYLASVSKQFTAACIALLVLDDQLSLDDDIRIYLPELPEYPHEITIRHLVHHTSGIKDYLILMRLRGKSAKDVYTERQVLSLIASQRKLNFSPGEKYTYSNSGYFLVGQIVKRVTGKSLREFAEERIFQPLQMDNTLFHDDRRMVIKNRVTGYERDGESFRLNSMQNFDSVGSGGLRSCVADLVKWDENFYTAKVGGQQLIDLMRTRGRLNDGTQLTYAFGLVVDRYKGLPVNRHGGSMSGFRTHVLRIPKHRFTAICLSNIGEMRPGILVQQIVDIYLKEAVERSVQAYVGKYVNETLAATYTLSTEGVDLLVDSGDLTPTKMQPSGQEQFIVDGLTLQFQRGESGAIESFTVGTPRADDVEFTRVTD